MSVAAPTAIQGRKKTEKLAHTGKKIIKKITPLRTNLVLKLKTDDRKRKNIPL